MSKDKKKKVEEEECKCGCGGKHEHECDCEEGCDCGCDEKCDCGCEDSECSCGDDCQCTPEDHCGCGGHVKEKNGSEYLEMAQRIQAEFENYRRNVPIMIDRAKFEGQAEVLEIILPTLDTFEAAKAMIKDEKTLEGIAMIENKIKEGLTELGVEEIKTVGEKYDPRVHNVIAVLYDETKEEDVITAQAQSGYVYKNKVVKYPKVIVNKKGE